MGEQGGLQAGGGCSVQKPVLSCLVALPASCAPPTPRLGSPTATPSAAPPGGGASVIYADTVGDLGYAEELGNYAEYSGGPNQQVSAAGQAQHSCKWGQLHGAAERVAGLLSSRSCTADQHVRELFALSFAPRKHTTMQRRCWRRPPHTQASGEADDSSGSRAAAELASSWLFPGAGADQPFI